MVDFELKATIVRPRFAVANAMIWLHVDRRVKMASNRHVKNVDKSGDDPRPVHMTSS
jgi:hypothetical protein